MRRLFAVLFSVLPRKMAGQQENIIATVAKRRDRDGNDDSLKYKSSRTAPLLTRFSRFLLVAATIRTSTFTGAAVADHAYFTVLQNPQKV